MAEETKEANEEEGKNKNVALLLAGLALVLALAGLYLGYSAKNKADSNETSTAQVAAEVQKQIAAERQGAEQAIGKEARELRAEAAALTQKINRSKSEIARQTARSQGALAKELRSKTGSLEAAERKILQQMIGIHQQINKLNLRIDYTNQRINALENRLNTQGG